MPERERPRGPAAARAEQEPTRLAERDEGDEGLMDARRDLVPVPGDAVVAVPVEVEAGGVELDAVALGEGTPHLVEDGRKRALGTGPPARGQPRLDPVLLV